jgi:hypothetical protein
VCPSPKTDEKSKDQKPNDSKGNGKPKPGTGSSNAAANTAASATLDEVAGAWSAFNLYEDQYEDPVYDGPLWELVLPHRLRFVSDNGGHDDEATEATDEDMPGLIPSLIPLEPSEAADDKHHTVVTQVGQCRTMDLRNDLPDNEDPDISGILELEEEDDELPETRVTDWVADHVATFSTDGKDDDPFGPMDVPALVAEWDTTWGKPFHASLRSLALMASPPAYSKGQIWDLYDSGASHHMTPIREDFVEFQSVRATLRSAQHSAILVREIRS